MQNRLKTPQSLRLFFALSLIASSGCQTPQIPAWDGKLYAGDHTRQSVRRAQDNEEILASDHRFSGGLWMTYEDFDSFRDTYIYGCEKWKGVDNFFGPREALRVLKDYEKMKAKGLERSSGP